jgi:hypothetical protein
MPPRPPLTARWLHEQSRNSAGQVLKLYSERIQSCTLSPIEQADKPLGSEGLVIRTVQECHAVRPMKFALLTSLKLSGKGHIHNEFFYSGCGQEAQG